MNFKDGDLLRVVKCDGYPDLIGNTFVYDSEICKKVGEIGFSFLTIMNDIYIYEVNVEKVEFEQGDRVGVHQIDVNTKPNYEYVGYVNGKHLCRNIETRDLHLYDHIQLFKSKTYSIGVYNNGEVEIILDISEEDYKMIVEKYENGS